MHCMAYNYTVPRQRSQGWDGHDGVFLLPLSFVANRRSTDRGNGRGERADESTARTRVLVRGVMGRLSLAQTRRGQSSVVRHHDVLPGRISREASHRQTARTPIHFLEKLASSAAFSSSRLLCPRGRLDWPSGRQNNAAPPANGPRATQRSGLHDARPRPRQAPRVVDRLLVCLGQGVRPSL